MRLFGSILALSLLAACNASGDEEPREDAQPKGHYIVDPETGETRASITNEDGTTVMRTGGEAPVDLPPGFSIYPDADVRSSVEVGRGTERSVSVTFASADDPRDLVRFYRDEAEAAGVDIDVELTTDMLSTIGGRAQDGTQFSFQATREDDETLGQLTVGQLSVDRIGGAQTRK